MSDVVFMLGLRPVTTVQLLLVIGAVACILLIALAVGLWRANKRRAHEADEQTMRAEELETRIAELVRTQSEMTGRIQAFAEGMGGRQVELARTVTERLDAVSHRLGEGMQTAARATMESLGQLNERLAVVDAAQNRLTELSAHMVTLKDVLANKQTRGAFGQAQMEAIVADCLPKDSYAFQYRLKNNMRPDCAVFLPGDNSPLVIDAKFPLESITAFREAKTMEARHSASQQLKQDMNRHISAISRYLVPGETQDIALMFVPSESIYADLYEHFDDLVQKGFRERVMLVSPSLLMLAIHVIRTVVKDARMREQAEVLQAEVMKLMDDVKRLHDRALKLQGHFGQVSDDVTGVALSAEKVLKRGKRIEALEIETPATNDEIRDASLPLGLKLGAAE
jgi:DNA recombination protein RmuC